MSTITVTNLNQGEVVDTTLELKQGGNDRFPVQGQKMYDNGIEKLVELVTMSELKRLIKMHNTTAFVGKHNILQAPFKNMTPDMNTSTRSRLKRKLIECEILHEFSKKQIMLNPYMFMPRPDKNIKNSQYMTQRLWKYVVEDVDSNIEGLDDFQDEILPGTRKDKKQLFLAGKFYDKPTKESK